MWFVGFFVLLWMFQYNKKEKQQQQLLFRKYKWLLLQTIYFPSVHWNYKEKKKYMPYFVVDLLWKY